ncbi:hypothetical protein HY408_00925 [Candidatus Gottesmanbacteria bacterium]|nr:hypothetical protein [Candidatus Gottesmanbacteria bacterium]
MHRNTAFITVILASVVFLLIGIRIGTNFNAQTLTASPLPTLLPSPLAKASADLYTLTHPQCGIELTYPSTYKVRQSSDSAQLTNSQTKDEISLICGFDFPKPPLPPEKIDEATIAGQKATIYHDASAENNVPLDVVIFTHPTIKHEVALFGYGNIFSEIITSLQILRP